MGGTRLLDLQTCRQTFQFTCWSMQKRERTKLYLWVRIAWLERVFFKLRACRVPTMTVNGYEVLWFRQERTTHCISGISFMDVTIRHIFHVSVRHICYPCISDISSMFLGWGLNYMGETGLLHLLTRCQTFQFKISSWEIALALDL